MMYHKLKLVTLTLLFLGTVATTAGFLTHALAINDALPPTAARIRAGQPAARQASSPSANPDRISITGRVLAPDGKPAPGARVAVVAGPRRSQPAPRDRREPERDEVLGSTRADGEGRFRIDLPWAAVDRDGLTLVASAPGWALAGKPLNVGLASPAETITLEPERVSADDSATCKGSRSPGSTCA